MNIALFQYGIGNLEGGGGAERFFADFFDEYNASARSKHKLFFIIDKNSISALKRVGKLNSGKNLLHFKIFSNRLKVLLESTQLIWFILRHRIKVIHIPLYNRTYLPLLKKIDRLPAFIRPAIVIQIVNCLIPYVLSDKTHTDYTAIHTIYSPLFRELNTDGYFSWYEEFVKYAKENKPFRYEPKKIVAVHSIFADTKKFAPASPKKNQVIFAARLEQPKHPEWFVEAVHMLKEKHYTEINNWQFLLFGDGTMKPEITAMIADLKLNDILYNGAESDLSKYFNYSKIFVSCQDYENFTSLSLMEAMNAGNAIIARDVGQTGLVLHENENGIFIEPDTVEGLANAILKLIAMDPAKLADMGQKSVELMKNTHNVDNFIKQIDNFWGSL